MIEYLNLINLWA